MKKGVRLFDPSRLTCLATDWSVDGVGFFLMKKYCNCNAKTPACCPNGQKLCLVGSRYTHPAESRQLTDRHLLNLKERHLVTDLQLFMYLVKRTLGRTQHHVILPDSLSDYNYLAKQLMPTHQSAETYPVMTPCPFYSSIQRTLTQLMTPPLLSQQLVP